MKQKRDVQQGTLALMVLKTLQVLGLDCPIFCTSEELV
jgi:hypothetical protein